MAAATSSHPLWHLPSEPTQSFPYQLIAKVGEGAMGEVYRAEDHDLHRQVAIKVVKLGRVAPDNARPMIQRFIQEARAAAAISHPSVPIVYRVGLEAGWPYIVMEWIEGTTLEAMLAAGHRFSPDQAARVGLEALSALDAAHAAGIVHRDIKPGNLMLTADGRVKVTDFGIARMHGASALASTQAGTILGTPWYAAPEQLSGESVDARADLYGVGCVLYEMVTGAPPYEATSLYELIAAVHAADPPAPSARIGGVPAGFDVIVQRALAVDPADRFHGARDMAAALGQVIGTASVALPNAARPSQRASRDDVRVPTLVVDGTCSSSIVARIARTWTATPVGRCPTARLLERVIERPLHATAFAGAVELASGWLLVADGLIYAAFDFDCVTTGDAFLEALPREVDATLYPVPDRLEPEVIPLLASLVHEPRPQLAGLDSSFADLPALVARLSADGFDGALRLARGAAIGFVLLRKGRRILDVFGAGWAEQPDARPWEDWIGQASALASVEPMTASFPSVTFRQQLRDVTLDVARPSASASGSMRSDAVEDAQAIELRPRPESRAMLRRGETTLQALVTADPAYGVARWMLVELERQFEQYGRAARWKALIEPLEQIRAVRLHHGEPGLVPFDVVTLDAQHRWRHAADRIALGTEDAVTAFIERALAAKDRHPDLGGAVLVAPRFEEAGLVAYTRALAGGRSRLGLDALRHREGFLRHGRGGMHVLLIEEETGCRRPLVPE